MVERKIAESNRGFKGVWIPARIWLDANLTLQEIMFLVEIDSLDNSAMGCYASNNHFSDFFGLSKSRVSEVISSLAKKGYISVEYEREGKEIKKRIIKVSGMPKRGIRKSEEGIRNVEEGYSENAKGSNTSFSNTSSNTSKDILSGSDEQDAIPYKEILDYLNLKANKNYKASTRDSRAHIKARWNEGFRLDDFKTVIDNKCFEWMVPGKTIKGTPSANYLRPATLFGSKFESYLNGNVMKEMNDRDTTEYDNLF
ncbi:MAG: conserved phage C-terminal domain-containing protein [Enterococcus sp.]